MQIYKKKVTFENVKNIGYEINLRFRSRNVGLDDLCDYLLEESQNKEKISIRELIDTLQNYRFELDYENGQILARYLVEDNRDDKLVYDEERTNSR